MTKVKSRRDIDKEVLMILLVEANVLTVGLDGKNAGLKELPIRLINMRTGSEAIKCLRNEKIDSVISEWDLPDMTDGSFLKKFKTVKPHMPTIAVVKPGDRSQEIAARSLGVAAVLTEDTSPAHFRMTVSQVLGLPDTSDIKAIHIVERKSAPGAARRQSE
jgi:response regulator RpfG family c-di-GMP phosphodiesterase